MRSYIQNPWTSLLQKDESRRRMKVDSKGGDCKYTEDPHGLWHTPQQEMEMDYEKSQR